MKMNKVFTILLLGAVLCSESVVASQSSSYWNQFRQGAGSVMNWAGSKARELYSGLPSVSMPKISDSLSNWYGSLSSSMQQKLFYLGALAATGSVVYAANAVKKTYYDLPKKIAEIKIYVTAAGKEGYNPSLSLQLERDLTRVAELLGTNKNSADFFRQLAPMVVGQSGPEQRMFFNNLKIVFARNPEVFGYLNELSPGGQLTQADKEIYAAKIGSQNKDAIKNLQIILDKFYSEKSAKNKEILKDLFDQNYAEYTRQFDFIASEEDKESYWNALSLYLAGDDRGEGTQAFKQSKYLSAIKDNIDQFKYNESLQKASIDAAILASDEYLTQEGLQKRSMKNEKQPEAQQPGMLTESQVEYILGSQEAGK